jgi:hypothetical protein
LLYTTSFRFSTYLSVMNKESIFMEDRNDLEI